MKSIKLIEYSLTDVKINQSEEATSFETQGEKFSLRIPGVHNVSNALGVITVAKYLGIKADVINRVFSNFDGIGRRLELIGEKSGIKVYDDYAHHPTAIKATIEALRQKYPHNKVWAIIEAHGFARTKALLGEYKGAFDNADEVIIGPIFKARDAQNFGVSEKSIADISEHKNISYIKNLGEIIDNVKHDAVSGDVVLVMGAGESYKWAREIYKSFS